MCKSREREREKITIDPSPNADPFATVMYEKDLFLAYYNKRGHCFEWEKLWIFHLKNPSLFRNSLDSHANMFTAKNGNAVQLYSDRSRTLLCNKICFRGLAQFGHRYLWLLHRLKKGDKRHWCMPQHYTVQIERERESER